jgi:hypothetical protein
MHGGYTVAWRVGYYVVQVSGVSVHSTFVSCIDCLPSTRPEAAPLPRLGRGALAPRAVERALPLAADA